MVAMSVTRPDVSLMMRVELQAPTGNSKKDSPAELCIRQALSFSPPRRKYVPTEWGGTGHRMEVAEQFGTPKKVVRVLVVVAVVVSVGVAVLVVVSVAVRVVVPVVVVELVAVAVAVAVGVVVGVVDVELVTVPVAVVVRVVLLVVVLVVVAGVGGRVVYTVTHDGWVGEAVHADVGQHPPDRSVQPHASMSSKTSNVLPSASWSRR
mmetsp:Transcript_72773/g.200835  ORF Transcript_72773/g.200835 Transcript_72773/m.200835 type:complete len:207 (-) Transcript_72773:397-1017(-)